MIRPFDASPVALVAADQAPVQCAKGRDVPVRRTSCRRPPALQHGIGARDHADRTPVDGARQRSPGRSWWCGRCGRSAHPPARRNSPAAGNAWSGRPRSSAGSRSMPPRRPASWRCRRAAISACGQSTPSRLSLRENGRRITAPGCQSAGAPAGRPASTASTSRFRSSTQGGRHLGQQRPAASRPKRVVDRPPSSRPRAPIGALQPPSSPPAPVHGPAVPANHFDEA